MGDEIENVRLGFLTSPIKASFENISLDPLPDHAERLNLILQGTNVDGFFYPPLIAEFEINASKKRKVKVPRSERPAAVYNLPASHELLIREPLVLVDPASDAVLLTQVLAFIFGTRLQLEKWRFEGRVPIKSLLAASIANDVRIDFLAHVYSWWKNLAPFLRMRLINVFYLYNRAIAAEWEWDAFSQQYIVFDALFRLHVEMTSSTERVSHKDRFVVLCQAYGVPYNDDLVATLYKARNELFHEGMWDNAIIGYRTAGADAFYHPYHLARLNARLLCAITGYKNSFTKSVWWAMGQFHFGLNHGS